MSKDELEGRVRAIEAILLELPEVTPDVIEAAKTRIRDPKHHPHPDAAEGMLKMSGHLDQHAEKALDKLKDRIEKRRAERRPSVAPLEVIPSPGQRRVPRDTPVAFKKKPPGEEPSG
jgi:hypothetical protein